MIAGRQTRVANEDLRLKYGEISTKLSSDIMALQDLVNEATYQRDVELGRIEQDRVNMQADLERLFPAYSMYGG
jgi:glucosamine 6-phosphate synthetase-like amidotransferase/phosphosugar isomerase protein